MSGDGGCTSRGTVKIKIGEYLIDCFKDDLMERSKYFAAMFSGRFREEYQDIVELKEVPEPMIRPLTQLLLGHNLEMEGINQPLFLLRAAVIYQFDKEVEESQHLVFRDLFSYLPSALEIASELDLIKLKKKTMHLYLINFEQLRYSTSFASIEDVELVYEILNHDNLVLQSEKNVFPAICFWLSHHPNHADNIFKLIQTIRFSSLRRQDILQINRELMTRRQMVCQEFLLVVMSLAAKEYNLICESCAFENSDDPCTCKVEPLVKASVSEVWRKKRISPYVPCLIGIARTDQSCIYRYDMHNKEFVCMWDCPPREIACRRKKMLIGFRLATLGVNIYLFGGEWGLGRGVFNTEVWCFSTISEMWTKVGEITPRRHFFICSNSDNVFLIGGTGKHRIAREDIEVFSVSSGLSEVFCEKIGRIDSACISGNYLYIAQSYKVLRIDIRTRVRIFLRSLRVLGSRFMHAEGDWLYFYCESYDDFLMKCEIRDTECGPSVVVCPFFTEDVESHELVIDHQFFCFYMVRGGKIMCKSVRLCEYPILPTNDVLDVTFSSTHSVCIVPCT